MSSIQSTPLKKKKSIFQKIKMFFNDIPDEQIAVINEASQRKPPQIKKSQSLAEPSSNCKNKDAKHLYFEEDFNEIEKKKYFNYITSYYRIEKTSKKKINNKINFYKLFIHQKIYFDDNIEEFGE